VKHRLLIERLRGTSNRRFSNAGCWFLTRDRVLVPYASAGRSRSDEMPFAVSLAAWAHIVRSLCPRTNDYEQTMVDLLDTPSVRPRGVVSQATVAQVLGRIDMLVQDSSEEIARRLLLDTAVIDQVEAKDPAVRERFIDTAIEQKKAEMERQLRETQEQVARERAARQVSEASVRAVNEELAREREARAEVERRAAALDQARAEHEQLAATRLADAEAAAQEAIAQKAADAQRHSTEFAELSQRIVRQERISRQFVAVLIAIIGVAVAAVPIVTGWITGGWPLVGIVCGGGGILLGAVAWLYGRKKVSSVAAGIGLVLGIIVSVQTIVTSTDHPSSSSTTVAHRSSEWSRHRDTGSQIERLIRVTAVSSVSVT